MSDNVGDAVAIGMKHSKGGLNGNLYVTKAI
jgi:hypothetical protein